MNRPTNKATGSSSGTSNSRRTARASSDETMEKRSASQPFAMKSSLPALKDAKCACVRRLSYTIRSAKANAGRVIKRFASRTALPRRAPPTGISAMCCVITMRRRNASAIHSAAWLIGKKASWRCTTSDALTSCTIFVRCQGAKSGHARSVASRMPSRRDPDLVRPPRDAIG